MWRRILALIVKELLAILKDAKSRVVLIGPPLIQLVVFGYAATFDLSKVPFAVVDYDRSIASRELVARSYTNLSQSEYDLATEGKENIYRKTDAAAVDPLSIRKRDTRDIVTVINIDLGNLLA